jgi:hypothetical protein
MRFGISYDVPSTAQTIGYFFMDIALYVLLAWYFDHIDNSNRGKSYKKLFFLEKSYWCRPTLKKVSPQINSSPVNINETFSNEFTQKDQTLLPNTPKITHRYTSSSYVSCNINSVNDSLASFDSEDESTEIGLKAVKDEKSKILNAELAGTNFEGLRVLGCSKTYKVANNCCGSKDVQALKEVIYIN